MRPPSDLASLLHPIAIFALLLTLSPLFCPSFPLQPTDVGVPSNVTLVGDDLTSYWNASDIVVERRLFLNSWVNLTGSNVTFRQCRFYFNDSTIQNLYYWILIATGDNLTLDQVEAYVEPSQSIKYEVFVTGAGVSTGLRVMNSMILNATTSIDADRAGTLLSSFHRLG